MIILWYFFPRTHSTLCFRKKGGGMYHKWEHLSLLTWQEKDRSWQLVINYTAQRRSSSGFLGSGSPKRSTFSASSSHLWLLLNRYPDLPFKPFSLDYQRRKSMWLLGVQWALFSHGPFVLSHSSHSVWGFGVGNHWPPAPSSQTLKRHQHGALKRTTTMFLHI